MATGTRAKEDQNLRLAQRIGAPSYNPTVPDDNRYWLKHGKGLVKGNAWLHEHTFAAGHPEHPEDPESLRSPYAVNEHGQALWIEDFARDMEVAAQTGRNILAEMEKEGLCRLNHRQKQIWRCGKIPKAYQDAEPAEDGADPDSELTDEQLCTKLPDYLREKIASCTPEFRKKVLGSYRLSLNWWKESHKELVAQLRSAYEQGQNSMWAELGLEKKRLPKRRLPAGETVKLKLIAKPNFVQSYEHSVQNAAASSYNVQQPSVQTLSAPLPLIHSKAEKNSSSSSDSVELRSTTTTSASPDPEREQDWVLEALQQYQGDADRPAACRMIERCRAKVPEITAGEICDLLIHRVGKTAAKKDNPVGYIFRCVDDKVTAANLAVLRERKGAAREEGCPHCGGLSEIDGRCALCGKTRTEARRLAAGGAS